MAECGLFLNLWLSFLIVTVIKIAGHVSMVTAISIFLNFNDITSNGELNRTRVTFLRISGLVFIKSQ
jgi:hypothetical protein